ncbi:TetR/AcrR family transcriptional regulator [Nocardia coffeae]|uniref:TetR/AcrR family transcriptional regulator n=1 Tax=Nocardia coffeae TaxID=2873381 RepID=UPI001F174890|nr:TetR/AcrR family transcriptional regulator [Nocardia coffeae]
MVQPKPAGRPKAGESPVEREEILSAALRAFARYGYAGVSVRTLQRELGVSHNLIRQRFGSKEGLWKAAVDWSFGSLVAELGALLDPTLEDPLDQLHHVIRRFVEFSAAHPELLALMNVEGASDTDRLDYIYEAYVARFFEPIGRLTDHLVSVGRIRPIPLRTLHFLIAHGGAAPFSLAPLARRFDPVDPLLQSQVRRHAQLVADLIIEGLRVRSA